MMSLRQLFQARQREYLMKKKASSENFYTFFLLTREQLDRFLPRPVICVMQDRW